MKNIIKKSFAVLLIACIVIATLTVNVFAAGTSIAFSKNSLNVGDTLTVTVRFSSASDMFAIQAQLHYDTSVLQFVSAKNGSGSSGIVSIAGGANGKNTSEEVVFKAVGTGETTVRVSDAGYSDGGPIQSLSGCSAKVSVVDKTAAKSSDANLKSLTPSAGSLTPKFSADVTTYSVTIPNNVTVLTVSASSVHSNANIKVEGSKEMKVGSNQRVIVVTAEDGTQKRYTLNITRQAANGTTPEPEPPSTENPTDTPTAVTADGKDKYIANSFDTSTLFPGYAVNIFVYNNIEFPCITKDNTNLLYLTDINGENGGFFRPLGDGTFEAFAYTESKSGFYEFLKASEVPKGYSEISLDVDGFKITAYQSEDPTLNEFALIWAKGPEGYEGFYRYDTVEHTFQRAIGALYTGAAPEEEKNTEDMTFFEKVAALDITTKIIAIVIIGAILLLIAAIVVLIVKIVHPGNDDEESILEDDEEGEEDFDFITISNRDETEE